MGVLIGREWIQLEWTSYNQTEDSSKWVIADHYNKGPHHFWYDVRTNLMVRQYQTEAALTIQTNWVLEEPDPSHFEVAEICKDPAAGLTNMSCVAPAPAPAVRVVSV